jgi:MarR family 2-MHQ and catechol resistance regulon transcriptional repressor
MYAVLTPEGKRLIENIFPEHAAAVERAVSGLDEVDRAVATKLLKILGLHAESLPQDSATTAE